MCAGAWPPPPGPARDPSPATGGWRASFDAVADDFRAALGWASGQPGHHTQARDLALSLAGLAFSRNLAGEAQRRYEQAAALTGDPAGAATAPRCAANVAACRMRGEDTYRLWQAAADAAQRAADTAAAARDLATATATYFRMSGVFARLPPPQEATALLTGRASWPATTRQARPRWSSPSAAPWATRSSPDKPRLGTPTGEPDKWLGIWLHWHLALRAEAAVLAGHPGASHHLTAARPIVAGNPIATAILDRAAALLDDDHERLLTTAAAFETAGCPYQRARTLILAGGGTAPADNAALAGLGLTPAAATG